MPQGVNNILTDPKTSALAMYNLNFRLYMIIFDGQQLVQEFFFNIKNRTRVEESTYSIFFPRDSPKLVRYFFQRT